MTTLEDYLIEQEKRDKEITKYLWIIILACIVFAAGYMAGQGYGYTQALADFDIIKGITIAV